MSLRFQELKFSVRYAGKAGPPSLSARGLLGHTLFSLFCATDTSEKTHFRGCSRKPVTEGRERGWVVHAAAAPVPFPHRTFAACHPQHRSSCFLCFSVLLRAPSLCLPTPRKVAHTDSRGGVRLLLLRGVCVSYFSA